MIDHLFQFSSEAEAQATLRAYYSESSGWRLDMCITGVSTYAVALDGLKVLNTAWLVWVSLPETDPNLAAMPQCSLVLDRDKAVIGERFVLYSSLDEAQRSNLFFQPVIAGSQSYLKSDGYRDIMADPRQRDQADKVDTDVGVKL